MVEAGEVFVVRSEPRHVVGVVVRQDDEGQPVAGRLLQVLHALADAADVGGMDAAVDQDMSRAIVAGHRQQEEVAEADPIHADTDAELAAHGSSALPVLPGRLCLGFGFGFGFGFGLRLGFRLGLGFRLRTGFRSGFLSSSHDQSSSCSRAKLAWKWEGFVVSPAARPCDRAKLRCVSSRRFESSPTLVLAMAKRTTGGSAIFRPFSSAFRVGASMISVTPPRNGKPPAAGTAGSNGACRDWMSSTTISTRSRPSSAVRKTGWNDGTVTGSLESSPSRSLYRVAQARRTSPFLSFSALVSPFGLPKIRPSTGGRTPTGTGGQASASSE